MNILITGGSGMVGTFITPYLTKKHNVTVFDIAPPNMDHNSSLFSVFRIVKFVNKGSATL